MNQNRCHQTRVMGLKCTQNAFAAGVPPPNPFGGGTDPNFYHGNYRVSFALVNQSMQWVDGSVSQRHFLGWVTSVMGRCMLSHDPIFDPVSHTETYTEFGNSGRHATHYKLKVSLFDWFQGAPDGH